MTVCSDGVKDMTHESESGVRVMCDVGQGQGHGHDPQGQGQGPDLSCSAKTTNTLHCSMLIQVNLENRI